MAIAWASAGSGVATETSGAACSPLCPATVNAGDILIAEVYFEGTSTTPSTPSGWDLLSGPHVIETTIGRMYVYGRIADGTEDGAAVAFGSQAVTTMRSGRIHRYTGRTAGTITELVRSFSFLSHATDPQMPSVTTTQAGALAVAHVVQNDNNALASATGESGGDWVEATAEFVSALTPGLVLQVQTCTPTADPGTVSGGSVAATNDPSGVVAFEIRASAPQTVAPGVGQVDVTGFAPTVTATSGANVLAGVGEATVTGFAPTVALPVVIVAGLGQATVTGFAPLIDIMPGTRHFDATSTGPGDRINFGTGGNRNDRSTTGQLLFAAIHRPGTNTGNAFLITKQDAFSGGYAWMLSGTTPSVLRLIIGRGDGSNFKDIEATEANACVAGQDEIAVSTFDSSEADGTSGVRHYRSALDARIAEVSAYTTTSTGTGTLNGDSTADLIVGNWDFANAPYDGMYQWAVKLWKSGTTPYTLAEVRRVQIGLLIMKVGHEEGDTDKIDFGKAMIESVATAVLLSVVDADGTVTDYSDNAYTGTLSGTTVDSGQPYWGFELELHNDVQPSDTVRTQAQDDYWYHSGGANVRLTTEATAGVVFAYRYGLSGYDPQANVGLLVDGAFNTELDGPDIDSVNAPTFSGLSAGLKTLQITAPGRGRPPSIPDADPSEGTFLLPFRLNRPWTRVAPTAPSKGIVILSESILEGYVADPITQLGCMYRLRIAGDGGINGVTFMGWGGYRIRFEGADAAGITNIVAQIIQDDPKAVVIAIGVNDYTDAVYTLSQYNARIQALIDALLASAWAGKILLMGPIINDNGFENDNAQGYNLDDIRASYDTIAAGSGFRVTSHDAKLIVDIGDLTDGTHPNNNGHLDLYNWLTPRILAEISNVLAGVGQVIVTGFAPTVTTSANVLADTGAVTVTGFAPTVSVTQNQFVLAGAGQVDVAGFEPTVAATQNQFVLAGTGQIDVTGFAPTVTATQNQFAFAGVGDVVVTGFAPQVETTSGVTVFAGLGLVDAAGFAPTVATTDNQNVLAGVGSVDVTGFAPVVTATNHQNVLADVGALTVTGFAPVVFASNHQNVLPGLGLVTVTGFAPTVQAGASALAGTGQADVTGFAPSIDITQNQFILAGVGLVQCDGFASTVVATAHQFALAGRGQVVCEGFAPVVLTTDAGTAGDPPYTLELSMPLFSLDLGASERTLDLE